VDVIQFPKSSRGNQYAVVFVDYLTKWPEVFALLSDRGAAFLSKVMKEVNQLMGIQLVEHFN
jgi:hypothetical protein